MPRTLQAGDLAAVLEVERQAVAALRGEEVELLRAALPLVRQVNTCSHSVPHTHARELDGPGLLAPQVTRLLTLPRP